ncbi:serine/arginine repetitive matrix protein 2-like [Xyrauchen texanus]|uniref:serine/arginine repetitive matrix protein 2-like n=1 Tax=Xyrauchen texanus TaxID=154827 RepID=UPI0022419B41|nr:serine/arginine repetitive matrix protein 2-like [Xyrauchen texanus]
MYRGPSNPDYHRAPVPPSAFGLPTAQSFGPPMFCSPFGGPPGPGYGAPPPGLPPPPPSGYLQAAQYGTVNKSYRGTFYDNPHFTSFNTDQSGSKLVSSQVTPSPTSQSWSTQKLDEQNQEVKKKAEEFLRFLEASERIELKGDKSETGDCTAEKHPSRARSRSRGKSRPRSRSRSCGRSQGRSRARSRGKSRPRSRSRSGSCSQAKHCTRAKSRPRSRSRSRSHGKSTRSKSQARLSPSQRKQSHRGTAESNHRSSNTRSGSSFVAFGLQSKDLEKHLPLVKSALLRNQSADETSGTFLRNQPAVRSFQNPELRPEPETSFGHLLPHESSSFSNILSWNTPNQQPETKPAFQSVEDEEKFLYGEEEEWAKPQAVTVPLAQTRSVRSPVHPISKEHQTHIVQETKAHASPGEQPADSGTAKVTPEQCEKLKNLLRTFGLNSGMADICKIAARLKEKKEEQGGASSIALLKPALEALQAMSKASKTDDSRSNRSDSSHSRESKREEKKVDEKERDTREKQIQKKRKEYLVKELEGLMRQEGSGDLIPVMGFFCQRCEEFFGDLNSAERHITSHKPNEKNKMGSQEQHRDAKIHGDHHRIPSHRKESPPRRPERLPSSQASQDHRERSPDRKRIRDDKSPHSINKLKNKPEGKDSKDESKDKSKKKNEKLDDDDAESTKSKKKKKEKKLKKKEKKKKDKKKETDKVLP